MKKLLLGAMLAGLCVSVSVTEESGGFVGVQVGYAGTNMEMTASAAGASISEKISPSGVMYGLVGGYKQFFMPELGVRYYINVDFANTSKKEAGETTRMSLANYAVNVDVLYNFLTDGVDFGVFAGLGLGANSWYGSGVKEAKSIAQEAGTKATTTSFAMHLNVGLRANIAQYHGVELVVKVPFIKTKVFDVGYGGGNIELTAAQTYGVAVRYTFSF